MSLDSVVNVTITAATATPTQAGFGTPLIMSFHTVFPERSRIYESLADMVTDGFALTDHAALAVNVAFAQNPRPPQLVVGREELTTVTKIELTPSATHIFGNHDYTVVINGLTATHTSVASPSATTIATGLKVVIDALAQNITVTDNTGSLDIDADTVADNFTIFAPIWRDLELLDVTTDGGIATDILAVQSENDDWYALVTTIHSKAVILAAAVYIETLKKLYIAATLDADVVAKTAGNIGESLNTAAYARTALIFHHKANVQYADAAWFGKCLPSDPGSITWIFHTLAGVDFQDLNSTEKANLESYNCNYYIRDAGISYTTEGYTASGEFIDVTRLSDWTVARIQENVFASMAQASQTGTKIPFTDKGAATIQSDVTAVLEEGVTNGGYVAGTPTVTVKKVKDVSAADRANRFYPDTTFAADLAGAIHSVAIAGVVSI